MSDVPEMPTADTPAFAAPVVCAHIDFRLLEVHGDDAAAFLHGQFSSDVKGLGTGQSHYSSYNSPKGRMLANFLMWRSPTGPGGDRYYLLLPSDLVEPIRRRLAMFVLRSSVVLGDPGDPIAVIGLAGTGATMAACGAFGITPAPLQATSIDSGATLVALPDGRIVIACPREQAAIVLAAIARHASAADPATWNWHGIAAGVPWITQATSDTFVPQAANWDVLGGVNFQKGCYPGQEIVARTQYLGRLKERLYAFHAPGSGAIAGMRLYAPAFGDQPCGTVVNAAPDPAGGTAMLCIVQTAAVDAGDIRLAEVAGAALQLRTLPYPVPPPTAARGRNSG